MPVNASTDTDSDVSHAISHHTQVDETREDAAHVLQELQKARQSN